jgi:teichoic acid transport system permease protein
VSLVKDLYRNRSIIFNLAKNDFKNRFAGSYLGVVWAFVQPLVTIAIYWIVFGSGIKDNPAGGIQEPYLLWLVAGICPWIFFNEALNSSSNCFIEYGYIVKKVVFKISILPMVKIISSFFVHIFFIGLVLVIGCVYGYWPTLYAIQALYYTLCVFALSLALSYIISSITVFFKDLAQIVNIVLQFAMWFTPIMYPIDGTACGTVGKFVDYPGVVTVLRFNPMYYVVQGYRDSFIYHVGFWQHYKMTIYFWFVVIFLFVIGTSIFKKLKPHFADVL